MTHFPLFMNLQNRRVLIFGGGAFALQRIEKLMPFGAEIFVFSERISDKIKAIKGIVYEETAFSEALLDLAPSFVVIAEDEEKTALIYRECKRRNIPVNAVDMPKYCDIIFPAVYSTERLCVGISSGGVSPTAAVELRDSFSKLVPDGIDEILEWMPVAKAYIYEKADQHNRKQLLRKAFSLASEKNRPLSEKELLEEVLSKE